MNAGKKIDDFKTVSRARRINLWLQIILGTTLYIGLNFVAARHYTRWDLSENGRNSLSPESEAYVRNLSAPVEIYAVVSQGIGDRESASIIRDLRSVFKQYAYASKKSAPVTFEFVNPNIESRRAEKLAARFGSDLADCVVVASGPRYKRIPVLEFYNTAADGREFAAEALLSSAILNVSSEREPRVYFLKGHGEAAYKSTDISHGLSEFSGALEARNYKLGELDLSTAKEVPSDCDLLLIVRSRAAFLPREIDALRRYLLNSNGRVMVFLGTGPLYGLEDVFFEWGIMSDDMLILDSSGDYESGDGDLIARNFPAKPHPVAKYLIEADMPVQFGSVRPVRPDMGSPSDDTLTLTPLVLSGKSSWAEKAYARGGMQSYNPESDIPGPLPLAMEASRTGGAALGLNIPGGRLMVFGDEDFIANKRFNRLGNSKLALNAVGWMLEKGNILNIPPRAVKTYSVTLSKNELLSLALRFFGFACAPLGVGIIVSFMRRR